MTIKPNRILCMLFSLLILLGLSSCQTIHPLPPKTTTTPISVQPSAAIQPTLTSAATYRPTDTPFIPTTTTVPAPNPVSTGIALDFSVLPQIQGILYLGDSFTGSYNEVDFTHKKTWLGAFNPNCAVFIDGDRVMCENGSNFYIMDLVANKYEPLSAGHWYLTPSEDFLYSDSTSPQGNPTMKIRRVDDGSQQEVPYTGEFKFVSLPKMSDGAKYFLGVGTLGSSTRYQVALFDLTTLKTQIIFQDKTLLPNDNIAWAYHEQMVVIAAADEAIVGNSPPCYSNYVLIHDVATQTTRALAFFPDGKCFDMFILHSPPVKYGNNNIWSPDNHYLALVESQKDLCVIEVDSGNYECHPSNPSGGMILNLAWSPDSQWIAFNTNENRVFLFSVKDGQFIDLGDMGNLNVAWLVWTTATQ